MGSLPHLEPKERYDIVLFYNESRYVIRQSNDENSPLKKLKYKYVQDKFSEKYNRQAPSVKAIKRTLDKYANDEMEEKPSPGKSFRWCKPSNQIIQHNFVTQVGREVKLRLKTKHE